MGEKQEKTMEVGELVLYIIINEEKGGRSPLLCTEVSVCFPVQFGGLSSPPYLIKLRM